MDTSQHSTAMDSVHTESDVVTSTAARQALGLLRIMFGLTFLWAFFDKLLALGFSTGRDPETGVVDRFGDAAWINGGSPTEGYLSFGTKGPFSDLYQGMAGSAWADWLFMLGLLAIGVALFLGAGMRLAAITGGLLYFLMWTAYLLPDNHPVLDDHLLGTVSLVVLALTLAGDTWGLGRWWSTTQIVRKYPVLR